MAAEGVILNSEDLFWRMANLMQIPNAELENREVIGGHRLLLAQTNCHW